MVYFGLMQTLLKKGVWWGQGDTVKTFQVLMALHFVLEINKIGGLGLWAGPLDLPLVDFPYSSLLCNNYKLQYICTDILTDMI